MKIGIYGGSFNPPHLGHMAAAESAAKYLGIDELLLIPAGIPPHKMLSADAAGAEDRLAMTRLMGEQIALDTGVKVTVSDMEIARGGKSYTADTLRILHEEHPDDELWLLMGTDMFLTFQYWYKPDEIVRYAGLCAFGRTEKDGEELFAPQRKYLGQRFPGSRVVTMTLPNLVDVSSTELRARIPKRETDGLLAPAVLGYIYRKHLYGTNLDLKRLTLEDLRPIALSYLKAKRIPHVLGTEQTAKALAEKYGADVEKARFAALLHDSTKRLSMEEQLAMCEHYHIELDELEKKALKLLHAKTGAALARDVFGADDEIYNAILWHTTGKANMTLLEKVIYLADYIEPNRDFDGVVLGYIYRKHLYGTNLDLKRLTLEDLRPIALSYLKAKRIPHVLGTEQTAKALAEKYGADVEKARFAALLHDSTKRLSMEEQLAMCEHYHIELDELEKKALKLLHAKTGAALARDVFGADDEIYNAILWHTTGKANMTLLEKVIYLADYIEPNRDFDGVEDLRKVVWEDLDKGLEMGLAMTVEEMEQMGNPVHHNTLQALEYLRGHTHE